MAPSGLEVPLPKDKVVPIKKQPHKSASRVYEYVPDLELRLSIREGTYIRVNSRKHRDDELKLLMREAQKEKTPQMIAERRLAREIRIRKRLHAKIRTFARNQMLAGAVTPDVVQAKPVVLQATKAVVLNAEPVVLAAEQMAVRSQPVALVVNHPMPAVLLERPMDVVAETKPMVAEPVVNATTDLQKASVKVEPQGEVTNKEAYDALIAEAIISSSKNKALCRALKKIEQYKNQEQMLKAQAAKEAAEKFARKVESARRARAAKAAKAARKAEASQAERNGEAAKAAAQPKVSARTVIMPPWLRQVRSEASVPQAIAPPSTNQSAVLSNKAMMKRPLETNNSLPMDKASTNGHVVSDRESSSAAEVRAAKRAKLMEKAAKMPGVRVEGHGPHGRNIEGSLMKWWDGQVLIACHCHSCLLTPTAFVMHAGHVNFTDPLKLISLFFPPNLTL